jgi:hypothetical protein
VTKLRAKHAGSIEIDLDLDLEPVAEAIAADLKDVVRAQPGDKWHKTGHLVGNIKAEGTDVTAPADRLQRDDLAQKFVDDVVPDDPTKRPRVAKALEEAADRMVKP